MEKYYQSMIEYVRIHPQLKNTILFINRYFPLFMFVLYPCLVVYLYITHSSYFLMSIYKPVCAFLFVTIIRKIINRPRPYETMNIQSLVSHKSGESFPSRHSVSATIIALTAFYVHPILGSIALIVACCICLGRILAGVHYISDVVVAMIIAMIIYIV